MIRTNPDIRGHFPIETCRCRQLAVTRHLFQDSSRFDAGNDDIVVGDIRDVSIEKYAGGWIYEIKHIRPKRMGWIADVDDIEIIITAQHTAPVPVHVDVVTFHCHNIEGPIIFVYPDDQGRNRIVDIDQIKNRNGFYQQERS